MLLPTSVNDTTCGINVCVVQQYQGILLVHLSEQYLKLRLITNYIETLNTKNISHKGRNVNFSHINVHSTIHAFTSKASIFRCMYRKHYPKMPCDSVLDYTYIPYYLRCPSMGQRSQHFVMLEVPNQLQVYYHLDRGALDFWLKEINFIYINKIVGSVMEMWRQQFETNKKLMKRCRTRKHCFLDKLNKIAYQLSSTNEI